MTNILNSNFFYKNLFTINIVFPKKIAPVMGHNESTKTEKK